MAEENDLERTEPASPRRLEQAREEGNVPHSRELAAFMVLAASAATFWVLGQWMTTGIADLLRDGLHFPRAAAFDVAVMRGQAESLAFAAFSVVGPIFLAVLVAVFAVPFVMGGWVFSTKALQLDFSRIDPVKGLSRMFSWQSLAELLKSVLKALLIGGVLYLIVWLEQDRLFALMTQPLEMGLASFARLLLVSFAALVSGLAVIAAIDVPFQRWQYHDRLKMTRDELRKEVKETEGDPQLKARIRSQQREMARRRMMSEVPKADVVVTNPTHFAVALKYDSAAMGAPIVVAKGMNLIAQRIRELAEEHHLPVLEAPPLARALHRHTEVGEQVPATLYTAVAEVMAWVYQLNAFAARAGDMPPPVAPVHITVPDGLDAGHAADIDAFINALTTNHTSFFREAHHFTMLAAQLRQARESAPQRPLRIWCAASATGEEVWSLAITACETFDSLTPPVSILASDIDSRALKTAAEGVYQKEWSTLSPLRLKRFFTIDAASQKATVRPELKALVRFARINLLDARWPVGELLGAPIEAIFCRNVMIYFDRPTQLAVLGKFRPLLGTTGRLYAGHSEILTHATELFKPLGHTVYAPVA